MSVLTLGKAPGWYVRMVNDDYRCTRKMFLVLRVDDHEIDERTRLGRIVWSYGQPSVCVHVPDFWSA